jgi:condensin complex subunit 3
VLLITGNYWDSLTPEKSFLARAVTDFCVKQKNEARIEALLPVVTALAFRIQTSFNALIDHVKLSHTHGEDYDPFEVNPERDANWEAEQLDLEFIVDQLFRIAVNMDYGDEVGRRKMFVLVRDMISQRGLPEGLVPGCLDVLRKLTGTERGSERDFIRLVVEVVQVMRDPGVDMDEEVVSLSVGFPCVEILTRADSRR